MSHSQEPGIHHQHIAVPYAYPVQFTRRALDLANPVLAQTLGRSDAGPPKTLAYLDAGLVEAHPYLPDAVAAYAQEHSEALALAAEPQILPGGEQAKDGWDTVNQVLDDLMAHRLCRHSIVLAAGGGAMLDAVGFAAGMFHRGVRLGRLPSTTLAQDDSGVGVKNGINLRGVKNLLGTFAPPFAVVNDLVFLPTLPHDVMLDGVAEAFKVAIIKDAAFFRFLEDAAERIRDAHWPTIERVVRRCAQLHLDHIRQGGDPFEMGAARPLDFGHWSAHRLESLSRYAVRHGQAVAIGIAIDSCYAHRTGLIERTERDRILTALRRTGLPTWHPLLAERDADGNLIILEGIERFREHLGGRLCITLPQGIGHRIEVHEMDTALIEASVENLPQSL
jgi:3-dehydroquinate synthase